MRRLRWVVVLFCWTQVLRAEILYVPSPYSTIQSAIDNALDGDTIVVSSGTYLENIDFKGNAITVRSTDPNNPDVVAGTIIDGSNPADPNFGSVVLFRSGEGNDSVLAGFTITGGTGSWVPIAWSLHQVYWNRCGGGALCYNMAEPTITKNVFIDNLAGQGGGVYVYGNPVDPNSPSNPPVHVKPVITDNTFINNTAVIAHGFTPPDANYPADDHGDGGAIVGFQGVDANIAGNLITGNHAQYYGGGIHLRQWSNGLIAENEIADNNSALGAGIHITYTSSPEIKDNFISDNIAGGLGGGGIYVYYNSNPLIERNIVTRNVSSNGAGIGVFWTSNPTIRDNMIVNNISGAGIRVKGGSVPIITGNTIVGNTASPSYAGGVDCITDSAPIIVNNIIASNGNSFGIYALTTPPVIKYNNVWGNGAGNYSSVIGDQTGINDNISADSCFVGADINDYHLAYSSPCINAGDPNFAPAPNETDFDGDKRILGQYVDMGADEVRPVYNLTSGKQYQTIQQAIDDANDFDVIVLTIGTYAGAGNKDIDFKGKAVTVQSSTPNDWATVAATIIDCQSSGRGFRFHTGEDANSIVNGLTIANGGNTYDGGAIHCSGSSPAIINCIIRNNVTNGHGAGIYCGYNSNAVINNCFFNSNMFLPAGYGGAIYVYKSSPTITNCIMTNNSANGYARHGGGICCWGDQDAGGDALVANCIVAGNSAGHRGGGLYAYWSSPTFINCTVIGNKALEGGGIGSFRESNPAVINCIVRDNIAPDGNQLALINTIRVWPVSLPTWITVSFSDIEGGQAQAQIDAGCTLNWGAGNIDIDPNFVDPGHWDVNNPGDPNDDFFVTGNYHLLPISGCIDLGDNTSIPPESTMDIDGEQRIFNNIADIGADEAVTNPFDLDNDGSVDYYELNILADEWLLAGLQTDFNSDGIVDFADFAQLARQWLWTAAWRSID
ncbi:MAG: right-handed parallel beta-helix repeat-containing protein [Planctomycetota bacterium]